MRITVSSSIFLGEKKTNIYYISEFSNVCYENGKFFLFGHAGSDINRIGSVLNTMLEYLVTLFAVSRNTTDIYFSPQNSMRHFVC